MQDHVSLQKASIPQYLLCKLTDTAPNKIVLRNKAGADSSKKVLLSRLKIKTFQ